MVQVPSYDVGVAFLTIGCDHIGCNLLNVCKDLSLKSCIDLLCLAKEYHVLPDVMQYYREFCFAHVNNRNAIHILHEIRCIDELLRRRVFKYILKHFDHFVSLVNNFCSSSASVSSILSKCIVDCMLSS